MIYTEVDFRCDSLGRISRELLAKLETMYFIMGHEKLVVTSGWRSEEHNAKIGGHPDSPHIYGMAVDVSCTSSAERARILDAAVPLGFWGIGIYDKHIHLDVKPRMDKNKKVWLGTSV